MRKILNLLQQDARMSHAEIGRQVHLSQPAVSERIKRLEANEVIRGYRADVNPRALGYQITAMIRLSTQQIICITLIRWSPCNKMKQLTPSSIKIFNLRWQK